MRRLLPVFAAIALHVVVSGRASAQVPFARPIAEHASVGAGRVDGIVTDQSGRTIGGASVLALGTAVGMALTDGGGRFSLSLPPGQYVLRATRDGYVSTYREAVRIQPDVLLRRSITLIHADADDAQVDPSEKIALPPPASDHAHTETAWRLRHLDRTVLRDVGFSGTAASSDSSELPRPSAPVDWLIGSSSRAASSFFSGTDFNGQVNFLATSTLSASGPIVPEQWGRGVAYVVVGAPIGSAGEWSARAAVAPGTAPSWNFQGEYRAREDRDHVFRTGVVYSIQPQTADTTERASMATVEPSRRAGGIYGFDFWTIAPGLTVDYGARVERYDYLDEPQVINGRVAIRAALGGHVAVLGEVAPGMAAPGAAEFAPPERSGAWLPPERTFSALGGGALHAERIERYVIGLETAVAEGTAVTFSGFSETTRDQIATVFGLDGATNVGHYYVARAGSVEVRGVSVALDTRLSEIVRGRLTYTRTEAVWSDIGAERWRLAKVSPSLVRRGHERGHDMTALVDAFLPGPATRVSVAYRMSNLFAAPSVTNGPGMVGGRFSVELQQTLPYRPLRQGEFNVLVSARTLLRDSIRTGAFYDELMTLAAPMQVACGIQMRF
jgi:hypothetical protein